MKQTLFVELFRFDAHTDYLPYYKKYTISIEKNAKVIELLEAIHQQESFEYDNSIECHLKINHLYLSAYETIADIYEKLGTSDWVLEPLSTYTAIKDLNIDKSDYLQKIDLFDDFLSADEKVEYYKKYQIHYYASRTLQYNKDYIGDHALLIAYDIIQNKPEHTSSVLKIISNKDTGIWFHSPLENRIHNFDMSIQHKISELLQMLTKTEYFETTQISCDTPSFISQEFKGFIIAPFGQTSNGSLKSLIDLSKAQYLDIPSAHYALPKASKDMDKSFYYKVAGEFLLDVKDNCADFVVVDSKEHFSLFDQEQKKIEKCVGREIDLPVITNSQFSKILSGEKNTKTLGFESHKVPITFL